MFAFTGIAMRNRGFTILEAMIALVLILVGILALTRLQSTQLSVSASSKQRVEASLLAQQVMEDLRGYSTLGGAPETSYAGIVNGNDTVTGSNTTFTRQWSVEDKTGPSHKLLTVTVGWKDGVGKAESVTLSTIIAPSDPALAGQIINGG